MARAGTKVGAGYVTIEPDFSGFQDAVERSIKSRFQKIGDDAGRTLTNSVSKRVQRDRSDFGLAAALAPITKRFRKTGEDAGRSLSKGVSRGSAGEVNSIAKAMEKAGVDIKRTAASSAKAMRSLERDTFGLGRAAKRAGVDLLAEGRAVASVGDDTHATGRRTQALGGRLRALGVELRSSRRDARAAGGGFRGFDGGMARVNRSAQFFRNILRLIKWPALIAGVGLFAQGLSALAAGFVATASAVGPLTGALVALPSLALAGAQAFSVLKLATAGVGDALKASLAAEVKGGTQAVDTMRQQEAAAERVADAKRNLADVQRQAKISQEDLTEAREAATRQLQDMRLAAEGSQDSEQQGRLSLIQARKELARTLQDPAASGLDIRFAEEAVDQAKRDLEQTRLDSKRAREDYADAKRKGVEGMPEVVAAKRAEEDANRAVADAQRDLAKAVRENSDAMKDQGSAATALQEKMSQLPQAGQKFVRFLLSLKPRLDVLRSTAASGFFPGAEKGLRSSLRNFGVLRGLVDGTSRALGRLASKAGRKLGSEPWGKDLGRLGKLNQRIISRLGDSTLNLADAFRNVLASAEPFLDWLSKGTEKFSELLKIESEAGHESGRLGEFFDRTRQAMERMVPILKGVGGGLLNVGSAARPMGNQILEALGDAAEGWRKWTDSVSGQSRIRQYFRETKPAIFEMGRLIRDAGKAFFELGRQKGVAHLLRLVRTGLIPALRDLVGGTTGFASSFLKQFQRLRRGGANSFDAFVQTLVEHSAEAGVRIAGALVKAFINAGIWGKLATGAFIVSKFGGLSAFDRFGKGAGKKFAAGFLLAVLSTELAKEIKRIVEGHELGAPKSEKFAMYLNEYFEVDTAKIVAPNRVKITTALGSLLFNSQTEKVIQAQGEKLQRFVGQVPSGIVTEFNRLKALPDKLRTNFQPLPGIAKQAGRNVSKALLPKLDELVTAGQRKSEDLKNKVGDQFTGLAKISIQAMESIGISVSNLLDAMNLKKPKGFNVQKALKEMPDLKPLPGNQSGGSVRKALANGGLAAKVPGNSTGDRHLLSLNGQPVARVESREGIFVGNRNYMAALERGNKEVPRLQKGGMAKRAGALVEPHITGPGGPLKRIGQEAVKKVYEGAKSVLANAKISGAGGFLSGGSGSVLKQMGRILLGRGLDVVSSAGVAGNSYQESGWDPEAMEPGTDNGGLFGFTAGEKSMASLRAYAARIKRPWNDVSTQVNFMLTTLPQSMRNAMNRMSSIAETTAYFMNQWERPNAALANLPRRLQGAQTALKVFSGLGGMKGMMKGGLLKQAALRLTGGGMIDPSWDPGNEVIASSIADLVHEYAKRYDADITQGYANPTPSVSKGHTTTGTATDVVPRSGNWGGAFAKGLEVLTSHGFQVGYDGSVPGTDAWPGHGRGDHAHINWVGYAENETAADARQRLREFFRGSGGMAGEEASAKAAPKENVPASYKGAKTGALDFGSMPKTLEGVDKQLARWEKEVGVYRKAKALASKNRKPATAQAIGANLEKIEARIAGLRKARTRLRLEETKKAIRKRLKGAFGRFDTYQQIISGSQRAYEEASQEAEQIVAVEPESPELGPDATDAQRAAAEKTYVENFKLHVERRERPAFAGVLERVADWRNNILRAEMFGFNKGESGFKGAAPSVLASSTAWEKVVRQARSRIDHIHDFSAKVDARVADFKRKHPKEPLPDGLKKQVAQREEMKKELPGLRLKDSQFTGAVGKARELFFQEVKNRIKPPAIPLPWSGTLEEALTTVQGLHPDAASHTLLGAGDLTGPPTPGRFGGIIWDLQETIKGLGLKVQQAFNGIAGGSSSTDDSASELAELEGTLRLQAEQRLAVSEAQRNTIGEFLKDYPFPRFHSGGVYPGPRSNEGLALLRGEERIRTPEQEIELAESIRGITAPGGGGLTIEKLVVHTDGTVEAWVGGQRQEVRAMVKEEIRNESTSRALGSTRLR